MTRRLVLAAVILAVGALITLIELRDGLTFSFTLLLGLLLVADGVLRIAMLAQDAESEPHGKDSPS